MANGFEMYEEYKKKKNQTPTIKIPTPVAPLPVVTPEVVYKQSNNTPSVKAPGGSLPKQYGIGFSKPTPIPENPFKNKVSSFLPSVGATPNVKTNLGYVTGQLPLQVHIPTPAQTYKDKAAALKEQIAEQQKAINPYRGVSSSMVAATQTQAQALPKGVNAMGLPTTTIVKPKQQMEAEQTIANLKGELAQAQNEGYAADYSQQWAALNKRTDADYIKARLARMATLRNSLGSDHSQNVGAMTEYQRIRGELEKLGVNAEGLADWLQRNSDYLEAAQEMAEAQQYATDKPLRASLASVGKNLVSGQGAIAGITQQSMNANSGEYRPINIYGDAFDASREKQTIRGTVGENIGEKHGQAAKFLYDIGMSMADSGATALAAGLTGAGGAASIILGSAVASDTMMNVVERGGSTDQAVTAGVLAGAAETIFESISLGKFLDTFKSAGAKSAKEIAKNALLQGVTEMSEEMATEVSNIIVDEVVMGSLSELNQMRANGATEAQIAGEVAKRIGLAGLGGFLSGGIFGTVGSIGGPVTSSVKNRGVENVSAAKMAGALDPVPEYGWAKTYEVNMAEKANYREQVQQMMEGTLSSGTNIVIGSTPEILKEYGAKNHNAVINQSTIRKIAYPKGYMGGKHNLGFYAVENLPDQLANPVAILKSSTQPNSLVIFTEFLDDHDFPVMIALHMDKNGTLGIANEVTSAYGRKEFEEFIKNQRKLGNVLYEKTNRALQRLPSIGLQLPKAVPTTDPISKTRIAQQGAEVNPSMDRAEIYTQPALPYNPNAPRPIPQNPAQGKFGSNTVGAAESNPSGYSALQNRYGTIPPGENPSRLVDVPKKDAEGNVVSLFARTGMESEHLPDELVEPMEQAIASGEFSHVVSTDKKAISYAEGEVKQGFAHAWRQWRAVADGSKVATKEDIALGELLLANAMKDGNVGLAIQLTAELCAEATRAGQNVQAFRLLKKMTPEGMLYYLQKTADNISKEFSKKKGFGGIKLDENLVAQLANAKTQQELDAATEALEQNIAEQVPATFWDIMNAWRYLAMLGNPTTHIRNVLGNLFFAPVINMKNGVAQVIEATVNAASGGKMGDRQKAIVLGATQADKALLEYATKDYESEGTSRLHDDKYATTKGNIMARRQVLPGIIGKVAEWNSKLLSLEDQWFSKPRYIRSLASYMKANGLTAETITPEQLAKARDYAVQEAQRATYQDDAALANLIKSWKNKAKSYERHGNVAQKAIGYASEAFIDSIMPFTKTPVNIVKRALEYSPVNLVNVVANAVQIKQGKATAADLINNFASAFTGTSLAALGYMLAKIGWVTGAGEEDKEDKYRQTLGEQNYSLDLGAMMHDLGRMVGVEFDEEQLGTYTIDWLAPEALVFFTGVAIAEDVKLGELNPNEILDALSAMGDPIVELSMMSGLNDALTSVQYGNNALSALFSNQISSYLSQYVPTIGGKIARTIDETNRQTYYDPNKKGLYKAADVFAQKAAQKIPFASKLLQPRIDVWGRESENVGGNAGGRLAYNMASPGYYKDKIATDVDNELLKLYEKTGEASVLPTTAAKTFKLPQDDGGETIRLNAEDYTKYAKVKGQTAYDIFDDMIDTKEYKALNSAERVEIASKVYQYANAVAKTKVSNYTLTDTNEKIAEAEKVGVKPGEYLSLWIKYDADNNNSVTQDEVEAVLNSSKLTQEQKAVVWQLQNSRWEAKNNPYTKRKGNRR